ncbi:MAG: SufD family Fe-S cluster assembly protein [Syntrophales bacterium]
MHDIMDEKAAKARDKKAAIGPDIDLNSFTAEPTDHRYLEDLTKLPMIDRQRILESGVDASEDGRSGTYVQQDTSILHVHSGQEGLEVLPIKRALEEKDWIKDYYWKLVAVDADKYTAAAQLHLHDGYVIRALPGAKITLPVQACLYIHKEGLSQYVHNLIIAEEDSELHVITGCATSPTLKRGLHVGISEFFVKKNAKLSFTMIHNWAEEMSVRPRSVGVVEEGGLFLNNYICMKPVRSLQMYPTTHLVGNGAVSRFYSLLVGSPGSELDVGGRILLKAPETRAEIIARAISNGGRIINRGDLIGEVTGVKAHLECRGMMLRGGLIHAIPELQARVDGVEMSHEAAVGKIAQEEILYLMSRGLTEDEATATIVRGFLSVDIPGLPSALKAEIDRAVEMSEKDYL